MRILLVVPIAWLLVSQQFVSALVLFFIAGVSDGLDGLLAKHYGWTSRLGALLDPLADKALLVTSFAALAWSGLLPFWLLALVVARDVVIVVGAVLYNYRVERLEAAPTLISKLNTLLQIVLVLLVIVAQVGVPVPAQVITLLIYAVTFSVVWSGLDYVITWGRRAREGQ